MMKQLATKRANGTGQSRRSLPELIKLNDLRLRAVRAKGGFLRRGTKAYMGFIEIQAAAEGSPLNEVEKTRYRQVLNGNLTIEDEGRVALIERALATQQAA